MVALFLSTQLSHPTSLLISVLTEYKIVIADGSILTMIASRLLLLCETIKNKYMNSHSSDFAKWITILIVMPFMVITYTKIESRLSTSDIIPAASITGVTPVSIGLMGFDNRTWPVVNNYVKKATVKPPMFSRGLSTSDEANKIN